MAVATVNELGVTGERRGSWRGRLFGAVAGLAALMLLALGSLHGLIGPWVHSWVASEPGIHYPELHHWHDAQWGALGGILFAGGLLALIHGPRAKPALMQFLVAGALILVLADAPFSPAAVILFVPVGLALAAYPDKRALRDLSRRGPWSRPTLALTLAMAILLAPATVDALRGQITGAKGDEHVLALHWITAAALAVTLVLGGILTATRRPGAQPLGILVGLALCYLGVTALAMPEQPGSWGTLGGALALLGGLGFIAVTIAESRRPATRSLPA